jgi:putative tryptophan/tyrosine transport system substrate-binding protein
MTCIGCKIQSGMRRREFIVAFGSGAVIPFSVHARHSALPLVGILGAGSPAPLFTTALAQGLKDSDFTDGRNVRIEYRWARGAYDLLPAFADELVAMRVNVLATFGTVAARIAKTASLKVSPPIPVVFSFGSDPVAEGLVASLNRPGGNITGSTSIAGSLAPKRLELLRAFLGQNSGLAILINPDNPLAVSERMDAEMAARTLEQRLEIITARDEAEIDAAFASLKQRRIDGLAIAVDTFYFGQMRRMAVLASRFEVPAIGPLPEFVAAGGLMTYGPSIQEVNRQAAIYVGKILKGAHPADLPVMQPTKFELSINAKAAKALGLSIPTTLLATADEVIE